MGSHPVLLSLPARCLPIHFMVSSQARDDSGEPIFDAGGVCVLVARTIFCQFCSVSSLFDPPPPTAVLFLRNSIMVALFTSSVSPREAVAPFARNLLPCFCPQLRFSSRSIVALISKINETKLSCVRAPDRHSMILMGDSNLAPEGSAKVSARCHLIEQHKIFNSSSTLCQSMEQVIFGSLIEMDMPMPSHVCSSSLSLSRTNRVSLCFPSS